MRRIVIAVCGLLMVAACGSPLGFKGTEGDHKLYEAVTTQSSGLIAVIDSLSHAQERSLPLGVLSADMSHLYSISAATATPMLVDTDPATGLTLHALPLARRFQLPPATVSGVPGGLSQNGRWLVLEAFDQNGPGPDGTHLLVVDTSFSKTATSIDLPGDFQFDAITNDGTKVYLIEYVSGIEYRVRDYDVRASHLDPNVVVDKSDSTEPMQGIRLSGVASPDGQWLYSVYTREKTGAFIHALNLDQTIAFCIDLPGSGYSADYSEFQWSLALSADGKHLFAANGPMGVIAQVDTGTFPTLTRTAHVDTSGPAASFFAQDVMAKEFGPNGAVLSPDGRTLIMAGSTGLVWVDTSSLLPATDSVVRARSHALADGSAILSLAASADGTTIYALNDAGMIAELRMSDGRQSAAFGGSDSQPLALVRVQ
jgi:hypothetical protein